MMKTRAWILFGLSMAMIVLSFFGIMVGVLGLDPKAEYNLFRDTIIFDLTYALSDHHRIGAFLNEALLWGIIGGVVSTTVLAIESNRGPKLVKSVEHKLALQPVIAQQSIPQPTPKHYTYTPHPVKRRNTAGWVYLLHSVDGLYKIGRTIDPNNRLRTFSVKLPFDVKYDHLIKCNDMYALETRLHHKYADKRIKGEWFNLSPEDVEYIKTL